MTFGPLKLLLTPPFSDFCVISGGEDFGHLLAVEIEGAGVERKSKESVGVAVVLMGFGIAENSGEEADDGIGHHEGGKFATGQYVVSDGEAVGGDLGADAFINAFVVSADENEFVFGGEFLGMPLTEHFSHWIGEDDCGVFVGLGLIDGLFDEGGHHDHAGAAAVGRAVDGAVIVGGKVSGIDGLEIDKAL